MNLIWFDLFKGAPDTTRLWLECSVDLERAVLQMKRAAQKQPGDYFVSESTTGKVVASVKRRDDSLFYPGQNPGRLDDKGPSVRKYGRH